MIDLHCHSHISDGLLSPAEVARLAHTNGCTMLSLTDTGGLRPLQNPQICLHLL